MQRVANGSQLAAMPSAMAEVGVPGYFGQTADGSPAPTDVDRDWLNGIQEELIAIITHAGITPDATSTDQIITALLAIFATNVSPGLSGTPTAPTPAGGDSSTKISTTAFVASAITTAVASLAPKASPALTGSPTAPTQSTSDNSTKLATTAFVNALITALFPSGSNTYGRWQKFPDGHIEQEGFLSGNWSEGSVTITLPTTFPNAFEGGGGWTLNAGPAGNDDYFVQMETPPGAGSYSSLTVYVDSSLTGGTNTTGIYFKFTGR